MGQVRGITATGTMATTVAATTGGPAITDVGIMAVRDTATPDVDMAIGVDMGTPAAAAVMATATAGVVTAAAASTVVDIMAEGEASTVEVEADSMVVEATAAATGNFG